jgi:hypothetical protein
VPSPQPERDAITEAELAVEANENDLAPARERQAELRALLGPAPAQRHLSPGLRRAYIELLEADEAERQCIASGDRARYVLSARLAAYNAVGTLADPLPTYDDSDGLTQIDRSRRL